MNETPSSPEDEQRWQSFRARLEEGYEWPCRYVLKAIVPRGQVKEVLTVLGEPEPSRRESKTGKYVSFTAERPMKDADAVVVLYRALATIEGVTLL